METRKDIPVRKEEFRQTARSLSPPTGVKWNPAESEVNKKTSTTRPAVKVLLLQRHRSRRGGMSWRCTSLPLGRRYSPSC